MKFHEKIKQMYRGVGYRNDSQFFTACKIYAKVDKDRLKNTGDCSEDMLSRMAEKLHCSVGDLKELQADALREELASKGEIRPGEPSRNQKASAKAKRTESAKEEVIESATPEAEQLAVHEEATPDQEADTPIEAEPAPAELPADIEIEANAQAIEKAITQALNPEDAELEAKIAEKVEECKAKQSYQDFLDEKAEEALQLEFAEMKRKKKMELIRTDMLDVCDLYREEQSTEAAAGVLEIFTTYFAYIKEGINHEQ